MPSEDQASIESGNSRLWGALHSPHGRPRAAVLFCHPLFEERKSACRVMVDSARALAQDGALCLRFDYRGCGDSPGDFTDHGVSDWIEDIGAAFRHLKDRAGACPCGILGLRLGGTLSLMAAAISPLEADFLALWAPVADGRAYLQNEFRRKLVAEMVMFGSSRATRESLVEELQAGRSIDLEGYTLSPALYRELCDIKPGGIKGRPAPAVLLMSLDPHGRLSTEATALRDALATAGARVDCETLKEPPFWNAVGVVDCPALTTATRQWISRQAGDTPPS